MVFRIPLLFGRYNVCTSLSHVTYIALTFAAAADIDRLLPSHYKSVLSCLSFSTSYKLATTTLSKKWLIYADRRHFSIFFLINGADPRISTTFYLMWLLLVDYRHR